MARASVVLVAGVSCSGKTTLARVLAAKLDAAYVAIDDYSRPYAELPLEIRKKVNFDSPEAIEHELLVHHLTRLRSGETIAKPMYDPAGFRRRPEIEPVHADRAVIVEGLFSLYWDDLRAQADLSVFVDTPASTDEARKSRSRATGTTFGRTRCATFCPRATTATWSCREPRTFGFPCPRCRNASAFRSSPKGLPGLRRGRARRSWR